MSSDKDQGAVSSEEKIFEIPSSVNAQVKAESNLPSGESKETPIDEEALRSFEEKLFTIPRGDTLSSTSVDETPGKSQSHSKIIQEMQPDALSSTLADETFSDVQVRKLEVKRGRRRNNDLGTGLRSRSVSVSYGKKRIRFNLRMESKKTKSGINPTVERERRSSLRLRENKQKRKNRLASQRNLDLMSKEYVNDDLSVSKIVQSQRNLDVTSKDNVNDDNTVFKNVQILVEKITDLVKVTQEMKEKINDLQEEIILLRKSNNVNQETTQKVKNNHPVEIKNVPYISKVYPASKEIPLEVIKDNDEAVNPERIPIIDRPRERMEIDNTQEDSEPENFSFLRGCFREQIGLPLNKPQSCNIFNFDETLIARGFNKAVITWQGLFWEHSREDIAFRNLRKDQYQVPGFESWSAKGVRVFRLTKPDTRRKPRSHRFAVNPPSSWQNHCNPLKMGKFYTHVYQTKVQVEKEMRTLRSKQMAKELKKICGDFYNPRKHDLEPPRFNEPSVRYMSNKYQNQVVNNKYKPLAELQAVPPYGSFYNTSYYPSQNQNLQSGNHNQAQTNVNFSSNVKSENPNNNNNNNNIEFQNIPVQYNQVISNPQMSQQFHPSLFLPQHQYQGHNQPFFYGNKQNPFFR